MLFIYNFVTFYVWLGYSLKVLVCLVYVQKSHMQRGKADAALSSYSLGLMSPNDVGCLTPQWWNDMLSLVWDNIDLVASGSWLSRPGGRAVMGGPEGVRGQPSTWLTQLVERLFRHTEDPGWLARWLAGWLTPTLSHTHKHIHTYRQIIHTAQTEMHILLSSVYLSLALSHSYTPGPVQTCGISAVRTQASTLDSISSIVSQWHLCTHAHRDTKTHANIHTQAAAAFRLGRRGACCPSSVISSFSLPPAISVPSALSALPLSLSVAIWLPPSPLCVIP